MVAAYVLGAVYVCTIIMCIHHLQRLDDDELDYMDAP